MQGNVIMLGAIRQELLSGIREKSVWDVLRDKLRAFPNHPVETEDYEAAAEYFNTCRCNAVQGTQTDLLLCAVAFRCDFSILTSDKDFQEYARFLPVNLARRCFTLCSIMAPLMWVTPVVSVKVTLVLGGPGPLAGTLIVPPLAAWPVLKTTKTLSKYMNSVISRC